MISIFSIEMEVYRQKISKSTLSGKQEKLKVLATPTTQQHGHKRIEG